MTLISTHFAWNVQNQTDFAIAMQMRIIPWSIITNNGQIKWMKNMHQMKWCKWNKSVTNGTTNLSTKKLNTFICILFKCSSVAFCLNAHQWHLIMICLLNSRFFKKFVKSDFIAILVFITEEFINLFNQILDHRSDLKWCR